MRWGKSAHKAAETPARFRVRRWHVASLAAFTLAGALFVTSSLSSKGLDLRAASVTDLASVVRQERARTDMLQARAAGLAAEVNELTKQVNDTEVTRVQRQVARLEGPAGYEEVEGGGLTVTLNDAPKKVVDRVLASDSKVTADDLVVHQQDIQAVVNALWDGGAEAITVQDQRIISTTGIRCVGNTVVLHGVPYSPPYRISAIGNPAALEASLNASDYITEYLEYHDAYQLGYEIETSQLIKMAPAAPALVLRHARPMKVTESETQRAR